MSITLSKTNAWFQQLRPMQKYLLFRFGIAVLGITIFTATLLASKNTMTAMVIGGMSAALVAVFGREKTNYANEEIYSFQLKAVVFVAKFLCDMMVVLVAVGCVWLLIIVAKFLFEDDLLSSKIVGPFTSDIWHCIGTGLLVSFASVSGHSFEEVKANKIPLSAIAFHTSITLGVLSSALLIIVTKIIL